MEKNGAVILRNVSHGVNDIYWFILPSLLPLILEQITAFLGVIAVFFFILGRSSDRFPRQKMLGMGFLVASVFLVFAALMDRLGLFILCTLIAAIGVSSYHPTVHALIDETTAFRQGRAYGMFELWGSVAVFFMFFLHGLLSQKVIWRNIILITSIPGLVIGSLYFCCAGTPI